MSDYCFKMTSPEGEVIGAIIYGRMAMANAWKKYGDNQEDVIELRRLCCIDNTPKNAESYFIGATIRWLKKNTEIKNIVSYADPEYGHSGVIYKASNFVMIGKTAKGRVIWYGGKKYHDKSIRTRYKGILKPFAVKLKEALSAGDAHYSTTQGKYIYTYAL